MTEERPLKGKRILISNDDGIHAAGLKHLENIAHQLSDDVWVVAPEHDQSGTAHSLTLHEPLRMRQVSDRKFAVKGTPTDCIMMALGKVLEGDKKPDLVLSGINRGANLGEDVTYSGTVSVALEAALAQIPAIALSQVTSHQHPVKWATAEHFAPSIILKLWSAGLAKGTFVNVNFPDRVVESVAGIKVAPQGQRELSEIAIEQRIDTRDLPYYWLAFRERSQRSEPGTDLECIRDGFITITALQLDLTDRVAQKQLEQLFS